MYKYLKDSKYYEDMYDKHTVESARRDIKYYEKFYSEVESTLPQGDTINRPGNAIILNLFYMQTVGNELLDRYENRKTQIQEWMVRDRAKDDALSSARLTEEPSCQHCSEQGLRIIDKSLMCRGDDYINGVEEVLFTLHCPHCDKNNAIWEDGQAWNPKSQLCPKCHTELESGTKTTKKYITFIDTCKTCGYAKKHKFSLEKEEQIVDPNFEKDRYTYCLEDEKFRHRLVEIRRGFECMARLGREWKEKKDNQHIYEAMKKLKKPKIAELSTVLAPSLEKSGYKEFNLDKPEVGKDIFVGFNCLDGRADRGDYESRKTLEKTIKKILEDTNWRLASEGVRYRLGYLSGRLHAYEREEDLKRLVAKNKKIKFSIEEQSDDNNEKFYRAPDGKKIIF